MPGIVEENYWFRRHEAVYLALAARCAGAVVVEAGCGEGYGADLLAQQAKSVLALDYDDDAITHVRRAYPRVRAVRADLAALPIRPASVDVVANMQVIEHLHDQPGFIGECRRILRPGGTLLISTPNRITFSPGRDRPLNPFHTRELSANELLELLRHNGFRVLSMAGLFHGKRLRELDERYGGFIDAQLAAVLGHLPGEASLPADLLADVASVTAADFEIRTDGDFGGADVEGADIDASLDLVAVAVAE
ncbi:MAG: class I SAM-dependent methyltransferase [Sciscionella sp.]|nr:class I SAM-dependent methyltransferase [Sciscionella sp.]